jgi:hypothetical protein
LPGG